MPTPWKHLLLLALLLASGLYAVAEELTIATTYPSPRGVYQEMRTTSNAFLATQGGNLGIGTTAPNLPADMPITGQTLPILDHRGNLVIGVDPGAATQQNQGWITIRKGGDLAIQDSVFGQLGFENSVYYAFIDNGVANMRVDRAANGDGAGSLRVNAGGGIILNPAGGNVGIGTANPQARLDVAGNIQITDNFDNVLGTQEGAARFDLIGTYNGWDPTGIYLAGYNVVNSTTKSATKVYVGGGGLERVTVDLVGGNVGIGTNAPAARLDVAGDTWTQRLMAGGAQGTNADQGFYNIGANTMAVNTSLYSYGRICTGTTLGDCTGGNGVVIEGSGLNPNGLVYISGNGNSYFNVPNSDVAIGTFAGPPSFSPINNAQGNLNVNDVYLRSTGRWASQGAGVTSVALATAFDNMYKNTSSRASGGANRTAYCNVGDLRISCSAEGHQGIKPDNLELTTIAPVATGGRQGCTVRADANTYWHAYVLCIPAP